MRRGSREASSSVLFNESLPQWPSAGRKEGNEPAKRNKGNLRHSINGVGTKFKKISELYKWFGKDWTGLDWSDQALIDAYNGESFGTPTKEELLRSRNGYYIGKQWMGVSVSMWKEDLGKGYLCKWELYEDPNLPHWWLDQVLK